MSLRRARSVDEYVEWVRQAVFEIGDLRDCLEYELEDLARFPGFLDPLQAGIKDLYRAMRKGTYGFGRKDLPFTDLAEGYADEIPFHTLLKQINETHRKGLEVDTDENEYSRAQIPEIRTTNAHESTRMLPEATESVRLRDCPNPPA